MHRRAHSALAGLLLLGSGIAACGPVPVAQAERICLEDARAATGPKSRIGVGIGTDGDDVAVLAGISTTISSDYIAGRDPEEVYADCVLRRSGQPPTRPFM